MVLQGGRLVCQLVLHPEQFQPEPLAPLCLPVTKAPQLCHLPPPSSSYCGQSFPALAHSTTLSVPLSSGSTLCQVLGQEATGLPVPVWPW